MSRPAESDPNCFRARSRIFFRQLPSRRSAWRGRHQAGSFSRKTSAKSGLNGEASWSAVAAAFEIWNFSVENALTRRKTPTLSAQSPPTSLVCNQSEHERCCFEPAGLVLRPVPAYFVIGARRKIRDFFNLPSPRLLAAEAVELLSRTPSSLVVECTCRRAVHADAVFIENRRGHSRG